MSNNSFLFATRAPEVCTNPFESEKLLWVGGSMVPVLWLGAFRASDILGVLRDDVEATQLFVPKARALSACRAFLSGLRSSPKVARSADAVLRSFENTIENAPGEGLQLDDYELQCLVGLEENKSWLNSCLAFVEDVSLGRLSGDAIFKSDSALELFDQAQVDLQDWSTPIGWEASLLGQR